MPPAMTASPMVVSTQKSVTNPMRLSLKRAKPALLKLDTAWNRPRNPARARLTSPSTQNRHVSTIVATDSNSRLNPATPMSTRRIWPESMVLVSVWANSRRRSPRRRDNASATSDESVMIPKPPIWMSTNRTTCPNALQCVAVSTTMSPVTHTAEVAVNSASPGLVICPDVVEIGSMSSTVPTPMAAAKASTTTREGERAFLVIATGPL